MSIKLLKKEEIAFAKSREKAQEIAEGVKISRRVDTLRQLQAQEEQSLAQFRDKSLAEVTKEIDALFKKRESLEAKVKDLEGKLSKMSPEMATTRKALESLKKQLELKEKELKDKEQEVHLQEIDIALARKEAESSFAQAKTRERVSLDLHRTAAEDRGQAEQVLLIAQQTEAKVIQFKEDTAETFALMGREFEAKSQELREKEQENIKKERALEIEKLQLADQRKTLERALARIKNNRL